MKLPVKVDLDSHSADISPQERWKKMLSCDVHMLYQSTSPAVAHMINDSRTWPYQYAEDNTKLGPPSFVLDTDDDLFNVMPLNPAFSHLGIKDHNGNMLKDGDKVWIRDVRTNEPVLLWEDGANVDYKLNRATLDNWRENLRLGEGITVSTNGVENYVLREVPEAADKVFWFPNCIDLSEYPQCEIVKPKDEIRVLWQGSPTHWEDWWDLKEPLARVAKKYPNVKFVIWGVNYDWLTEFIDRDQIMMLPWMDYRQYKVMLATIGADINLAPLRPTTFNQSRSAIKFYEPSALWVPPATLAQNTAQYGEDIIEGETGLLFNTPDEFETKLSGLIEDAKLRRTLGDNAKDWIRTHRDPTQHALRYYEHLLKVREARLEWPEPPQKKKGKKNGSAKTKYSDVRKRQASDMRKRGN